MLENNFNWGLVFAVIILLGLISLSIILLVKGVRKARQEAQKEEKEVYANGLVVFFPTRGTRGKIRIQIWYGDDITSGTDHILVNIAKAVKIRDALSDIIRKVIPDESLDHDAIEEHSGNSI